MFKWSARQRAVTKLSAEHYACGSASYRSGKYEAAIEELSYVCDQSGPVGQMARYYQGMAHRALAIDFLRSGDYERSEFHFKKAIDRLGSQADLASYLATIYGQTGRYSQCAQQMEKVAGTQNSSVSWRKLAQVQWQAGQRFQAYQTLQKAMRTLGADAQLHLQLGLFYAAEEKFQIARDCLSRAAELDCSAPEPHYYLGLVAAASGDARAAIRSFQRALFLKPTDLMLAYQLAMAAKAAANNGAGVVVYPPEKLSPMPASSTHAWQLAQYVCEEPDFLEAMFSLPEGPDDHDLFEMLGGVVQMALSVHPAYADLHFHCSRILSRLGRADAALTHVRRAVEINPRYVKALVQAAKLLAAQKQHAEALEFAMRAIAAGADWPDVHCLAGELHREVHGREVARKHLERALQLNPNYKQAQQALRGLAA